MTTAYSLVYDKFMPKIDDYIHDGVSEINLHLIFKTYLKSAVPKFYQSNTDLTRNDSTSLFNETLTELEQEIIASIMVIEWLNPRINYGDLLEQYVSPRELQVFSPANQIKELRELKKDTQREIDNLIVTYSYSGDLSGLS